MIGECEVMTFGKNLVNRFVLDSLSFCHPKLRKFYTLTDKFIEFERGPVEGSSFAGQKLNSVVRPLEFNSRHTMLNSEIVENCSYFVLMILFECIICFII